ncbi:MAG: response regulator [Chitinophagaceae bacterium]|nr:MAG: response regulator [Chitinophagaceae bacterium]
MSPNEPIRILYADDDSDDIELLKHSFAAFKPHIELITFPDGYDLTKYLYQYSEFDSLPCLIIVDMNMPKFDGKVTVGVIKDLERFHNVPMVIFTTSSHPMDQKFARDNQVGFITKPINGAQMRLITEKLLTHCSDAI